MFDKFSKGILITGILLSGSLIVEQNLNSNTVEAATLSKSFTITKSASSASALPAKVYYSKRVKEGIGYVTYSGYLYKTSSYSGGGQYFATYSGTLSGVWS